MISALLAAMILSISYYLYYRDLEGQRVMVIPSTAHMYGLVLVRNTGHKWSSFEAQLTGGAAFELKWLTRSGSLRYSNWSSKKANFVVTLSFVTSSSFTLELSYWSCL